MRAVRYHRFGPPDVLRVEDVPPPSLGGRDVRIRVAAAALNPKDILLRKGKFAPLASLPGFRSLHFPRGTGFDVAGTIEEIGRDVSSLRIGDRVFGFADGFRGASCADEMALPERWCALAPARLSFEEAASLPLAASTSLQALRDLAEVKRGDRVLLHGASGGVGVHAIQIAKALGGHVTTTSSETSRARCHDLGADETLTYDDPAAPFAGGARYDAIVDVYGNRSLAWARRGLQDRGVYITTVPSTRAIGETARTLVSSQKGRLVVVKAKREDLDELRAMVDDGRLRPVVDRVLSLEETRDAHAYIEQRHARGKVVITTGTDAGG